MHHRVAPFGMDTFIRARVVDAAAGILAYEPAVKKVAIVGAGRGRETAPVDDPTWAMWGLNEIAQPRATAWFELHPISSPPQSAQDLAWLRACPTPCYVLDLEASRSTGVVNPVQFPIDRILEMPGARDWFSSTFSYQIALAILDGFQEIGLWGVSLRHGTARERTVEFTGLAWWLGYAAGRGVTVTLPSDDTWTYPARYGYAYEDEKHAIEDQMRELRRVIKDG